MRSANRVFWCRRFLVLAFLSTILPLTAAVHPARAELLFFKDGFPVEGKVTREMTIEFDQVGRDAYYMPKGFFFLNDGPRRIFFSPARVRYVSEKDPPAEDRIIYRNPRGQVNPKKFPGLAAVISAPEWGEDWSRRFEFLSGMGAKEGVPQHISVLRPYWAQVDSMGRYFWSCAYLTRELGPETVQALLSSHADFQEKKNLPAEKRASLRLRKADFFAQAGFLDLADKELDRLAEAMPDQKERVETARKMLINRGDQTPATGRTTQSRAQTLDGLSYQGRTRGNGRQSAGVPARIQGHRSTAQGDRPLAGQDTAGSEGREECRAAQCGRHYP
jgi:hypothetical protein